MKNSSTRSTSSAPTSMTMGERYTRWWLDDYAALDGRLRFVFYSVLLHLTKLHSKSFFRAIKYYEKTDPELFFPRGLMGFLGVQYIEPDSLRTVMVMTKVMWVLAAIGLFTRVSSAATAAGVLFLHGVLFDATGGNRSWYITVYSLLFMAFARSRPSDPWSVDFHLRKSFGRSEATEAQQPRHRSVLETGFARKCVLIMVVAFYFASGVGKLHDTGLEWADGQTLQYQANGRDEPLAPLLSNNLWLCRILSIGALFIEAGAILMLFSKRIRFVFLILLSMMHVGIKYSMGPFYFANIWCFILLVDWAMVGYWLQAHWIGCRLTCALFHHQPANALLKEAATLNSKPPLRPPVEIGTATGIRTTSARAATACGTALLVLMAAVSFLQIEWWPLTNVDLYSTYNNNKIEEGYPRSDYEDVTKVQEIARGNRHAQGELAHHVEFRLIQENGKKKVDLSDGVGVSRMKQWGKSVMRPVIVEDFLSKPEGNIEWDPKHPDNPASLFLRHILPSIKRNVKKWKDYDYAVLRYEQVDSPNILIAKVPLEDPDWTPPGKDSWRPKNNVVGTHPEKFTFFAMAFLIAGAMFLYTTRARDTCRTYLMGFLSSEELPIHETVALKS